MVPKVAGKGKSFKGAAAYYLHDKQARSAERVAFTHTENLPTHDADLAWRVMARTAMNQNEIKAAAGGTKAGRKLKDSVYVYSLSWAPGEQPTQAEMIEAGRQTLKTLGIDSHQVLMVAHNDEPHPHLHVLVNRVHPETGLAAKLGNDHLKLSEWALAYEKAQGKIRCEQRAENQQARRQGAYVKHEQRHNAAEYRRWRSLHIRLAHERQEAQKRALLSRQEHRRAALIAQRDETIAKAKGELRERAKNNWRTLYLAQEFEREKVRFEQRSAVARLAAFVNTRAREIWRGERADSAGLLSGAFSAVTNREAAMDALDARHKAQRKELGGRLRQAESEAVSRITRGFHKLIGWDDSRAKKERDAQQRKHTRGSQQRAYDLTSGRMERLFEAAKDLEQEFADKAPALPDSAPSEAGETGERKGPLGALRALFAGLTDSRQAEADRQLRDMFAAGARGGKQDPPHAKDDDKARGSDEREDGDERREDRTEGDEDRDEQGGGGHAVTRDEAQDALREIYRIAAELEAQREAEEAARRLEDRGQDRDHGRDDDGYDLGRERPGPKGPG